MRENSTSFKPALGLFDATMIVAGSMIGSGIFIVSADITRNVGSAGWLIVVWLITGFMTLTAAVSYGELSGMFPRAGGQYVYLREAYNPLMGFLYGWSFFSVIQTGTIAAVGVAFSKFAGYFFPVLDIQKENILADFGWLTIYPAQLVSIGLILFLTYTNTRGVKGGKLLQNIFTATKLLSLFGLIIAGLIFFKPEIWKANWSTGFHAMQNPGQKDVNGILQPLAWKPISGLLLAGAITTAMVGSIFSSDAWNNVTFIAGEIKNPKKNIGLSLLLGTLTVTVIYVCANLVYTAVIPLEEIAFAPQERVAVAAARSVFGNTGQYVIAVMIMISTFGCNNGLILAGARVYYSMAKDGLFFKNAGILNIHSVPAWALWAQAVVASLLCLSGRYGDLLTMVSFVVVIFYILTIIGIFILRKKRPAIQRPYKAFGYPLLPVIYIVLALGFCTGLVFTVPAYSLWGLGITLAGIPFYYFAVTRKAKPVVES